MRLKASTIFLFLLTLSAPLILHAATKNFGTTPFGAKVLSIQIPTVTCITSDGGTAPVLLNSNLLSLGNAAATSAGLTQDRGLQRSFQIGKSIYRAIPLYTLQTYANGSAKKQPKPGDWILGRQKIIPDLSTCTTEAFGAPIPFPVVQTDNYGVSRPTQTLK